jgi:DNA-binding NarL/FixJ family response regulator
VFLARGEAGTAAAILERHRASLGNRHIELATTLGLLVDAYLAIGDLDSAAYTADQLTHVADQSGRLHASAVAALARGHVLTAGGHSAEAAAELETALRAFTELDLPLDAACAHLDLAHAMTTDKPELAVAEAQRALTVFEQLGATRDADRAAAFLRGLGAPARVGRKNAGILTQREQQVLRLVGRGLTNPEIATRLFISRKTAAHHVSSILAKLGLRNRAEAVAYASRDLRT